MGQQLAGAGTSGTLVAPATATWRSGYATVCKTVYPGSIPGVASSLQLAEPVKGVAPKRSEGGSASYRQLCGRPAIRPASRFQCGNSFVICACVSL